MPRRKKEVANPRMKAYDARNKKKKIVVVKVRVPEHRRDEILAEGARMRAEHVNG